MRIQLFPLVAMFTALTSAAAFSQTPQATNCHTLESSGNFVAADETIVNGMVCKSARSAQPQVVAEARLQQISTASQQVPAQDSDITNVRIVELTKMGLDDEIIIAKMKNGKCRFQLGDADLVALKKAGVSSRVIAAMLDAGVLSEPRVTVDKNVVALHILGQAKVGGRLGHLAAGVRH